MQSIQSLYFGIIETQKEMSRNQKAQTSQIVLIIHNSLSKSIAMIRQHNFNFHVHLIRAQWNQTGRAAILCWFGTKKKKKLLLKPTNTHNVFICGNNNSK